LKKMVQDGPLQLLANQGPLQILDKKEGPLRMADWEHSSKSLQFLVTHYYDFHSLVTTKTEHFNIKSQCVCDVESEQFSFSETVVKIDESFFLLKLVAGISMIFFDDEENLLQGEDLIEEIYFANHQDMKLSGKDIKFQLDPNVAPRLFALPLSTHNMFLKDAKPREEYLICPPSDIIIKPSSRAKKIIVNIYHLGEYHFETARFYQIYFNL